MRSSSGHPCLALGPPGSPNLSAGPPGPPPQMRVHLMGAGGAGVSALARVFLARGDDVSGCDVKESETTAELEEAGVRIKLGPDPERVLGQDLLVYSGATKRSPQPGRPRAKGVQVPCPAGIRAPLIAATDST